nr:winged helix-turn-helix transcriptional regulator [uncultured Bacteroides sp.]
MKVEYSLTEADKKLIPIIDNLWQWVEKQSKSHNSFDRTIIFQASK